MYKAIIASAALLASVGMASAASITVSYSDLPTNGSYYAPTAVSHTDPYEANVTGTISGLRRSPFDDTITRYDAVEANGSATFGMPVSVTDVLFKSSATFGTGNDKFSFVWGSPDSYNSLSFFNGTTFIGSINGGSSPSTGSGGYLATVTGMGQFTSVEFQSQGQNAFEFAAVSAVPLPASAPLFGAALLALAGFGYGMNRWVAPKGKKAVSAA